MLNTTLNEIRKHGPRRKPWKKLLSELGKTKADDDPLSLREIYQICGFDDALWALQALPPELDNEVRLLVCDLVEPEMKLTTDPRPQMAIDTARRFARGEATRDELDAARAAAWAARAATRAATRAAARAAWAATRDAAWAAWAAGAAAGAAAWAAARAAGGAARDAAWAAARAAQEGVFKAWLDRMDEHAQTN